MDGISSLPDDLLHAILTFLGDAPAAVTKTAALSRRWRHVWTGARNLTFKDSDTHPETNRPSSQQLAGFVNWVHARRCDSNNSMDSLKIQFTAERGQQQGPHASASPEQVSEWLRYACQHVVKSVEIDFGQRTDERPRDEQRRQVVVVKVPSHGRAESISLRLPNHRFQLLQADPAAAGGARHEALTKLELFQLSFSGDDGGGLGDFVSSSCCPRLRRLQIASPYGLRRLSLRSHALEELLISSASDLETLDVATPNLRLFDMLWCFTCRKVYDHCDEYIDGTGNKIIVRVVAPRPEEIVNMRYVREQPADLDIRGLASVRRLSELQLNMHGKYHVDTDVGFWLLENCPGVEHVQVWLSHMRCRTPAVDNQFVDLTWAAPLAKVRSLCVRASCYLKDDFVASMSSLLVRCPHLTSLSVDLGASSLSPSTWACFCDAVPDKLEIRGKVALESLEKVEMTGFGGTQEEMQLVALLFESSSSSIKRMALVQLLALVVKRKKVLGEKRRDVETIRRELMKIPCAHVGRWRLSQNTFTWTRN